MRIASGVVDQYIDFVAVSATTGERLTGLSSFTVHRSRNGGAVTAMTTPTVTEKSAGNMPGVYKLLMDEDMSIDAGDYTQVMTFHISATGMRDVTMSIELFNPLAVLDLADAVETGISQRAALRIILSAQAGKISGAGTGTETFRNTADTKDRIVSTVDVDGNRTAVTVDGT